MTLFLFNGKIMKRYCLISCALFVIGAANGFGQSTAPTVSLPPVAPVRPVTDEYFGIKVVDPYRYMENLDDPMVQAWLKGQADYTRSRLDAIPGRAGVLADIKKYVESVPARVRDVHRSFGGRYFYLKTLAGQSLAKLYMRQGIDGKEVLLIDTDQFIGPKGEPAAINSYEPSDDGQLVAYTVSLGGAEIGSLRIRNVDSGKDTGEAIDRIWEGDTAWRPDNQSFFYNRLQKLGPDSSPLELEQRSKVYLHIVGHSPDEDAAVFGIGISPDVEIAPADLPFVMVQPGSDYAVGVIEHGVQRESTLYVALAASLGTPAARWTKLCDTDAGVTDLAVQGSDIYLLTHKEAPRFKILMTSLSHPDIANAQTILPQSQGVMRSLHTAADGLYATESDGGVSHLIRVPYGGTPTLLKLPVEGSVGVDSSDPRLGGVVFSLTSWTQAARIFEVAAQSDEPKPTDLQPVGPYDQPDDLTSMELKVHSYDGTEVPLSIVFKKGMKMDGTNPTILYAYGAYGISMDAAFGPSYLAWFERGGVLAIAHVRGGGEYGEEWHKAGYKLTKPNTWRDVIACGQYLIDKKYTSPAHLGVQGGSAGGITVGRTITERPELFAAAVPQVGVMNPLRSETYANGIPNIPEFGSVKTQEGFEDLQAMDSYHHVRDGVAYPAVMLTAGIHDPRVTPWMPAKMAARLAVATSSGNPILLRVEYAGGHGIGASKLQREEESADVFSFLLWRFGDAGFQPAR
jgi:prolyl oligopeptidase